MYRSVIVILIASISVLLVSCEEPDTEAPTISIISPESGSIVSEGVSITCIATDNKGIKKVELWVDAVATAEIDDTEPFSLIWNTVEYLNGSSHTISLRAYDLSGNKTDTEPITLTINQTDAFPTPVDITSVTYDVDWTEMTATWQRSPDTDFSAYKLLFGAENIEPSEIIFNDVETTSHTISSFDPYVENWFQIIVTDIWGLSTVGRARSSTPETAPTASVSVNFTNGYTGTLFSFDASNSRDPNEPDSGLKIRWDWENDGTWDTEFSTEKLAEHQYMIPGTFTVLLEVKDIHEATDLATTNVSVIEAAGSVEDIDGNVYSTVVIGAQEWMAENLRVSRFRNGDSILTDLSSQEWNDLYGEETAAYCVLNNDPANTITFGYLYNWIAAGSNYLCPQGWHLPTDEEWKELEMYLGMSESEADIADAYRGTSEGSKIAGNTSLWSSGNLKNSPDFGLSNFNAYPGEHRDLGGMYSNGVWGDGNAAFFWTATENGDYGASYRELRNTEARVYRYLENKYVALSVRLVRD